MDYYYCEKCDTIYEKDPKIISRDAFCKKGCPIHNQVYLTDNAQETEAMKEKYLKQKAEDLAKLEQMDYSEDIHVIRRKYKRVNNEDEFNE